MNSDTPHLPSQYCKQFNIRLNSRQATVGDNEYLNSIDNIVLNENSSFKNIATPPHINL